MAGDFETIPSSGDERVDAALRRLREQFGSRFQALEDAMLVQANLEAKSASRIKEHAEFLVRHEGFIAHHEEMMSRFDTKMLEIEEKVNFLLNREMKREGGPEGNPG